MPAKNSITSEIRLDPIGFFYKNFRINKNNGCWEWIGLFDKSGYGRFFIEINQEKTGRASRASWLIHRGPIKSSSILVCHSCDNPACVNPDHLFLGTCKDNMQDCKNKNRLNIGEDRPQSKLTEENVREARQIRQNEGMTWLKLGKRYNVSAACITMAVMGRTWSHVDEPIPTFNRPPGFQLGHERFI